MNLKLRIALIIFVCSISITKAQNLLDTSTWTIGCGSVSGFNQHGSTSENCRELGRNHVGEEVMLWVGGNDTNINSDGGWYTNFQNINPNLSLSYFPLDKEDKLQ